MDISNLHIEKQGNQCHSDTNLDGKNGIHFANEACG